MSDHHRYWNRVLRDCRRSGLSRAAFCRRQGISYHGLSYWKRRLEGEGRDGRSSVGLAFARPEGQSHGHGEFLEVAVQSPRAGARAAGYEIVLCCGRVVRVPQDFETEAVTRLIAAAEGAPSPRSGTAAESC